MSTFLYYQCSFRSALTSGETHLPSKISNVQLGSDTASISGAKVTKLLGVMVYALAFACRRRELVGPPGVQATVTRKRTVFQVSIIRFTEQMNTRMVEMA